MAINGKAESTDDCQLFDWWLTSGRGNALFICQIGLADPDNNCLLYSVVPRRHESEASQWKSKKRWSGLELQLVSSLSGSYNMQRKSIQVCISNVLQAEI